MLQIKFFSDAFGVIESMNNDLKIIMGVFNTVLDTARDIWGGNSFSNAKTRKFLLEFLQANHLVDMWRLRNPEVFAAFFRVNNLKERLDFFLISSALIQNTIKVEVQHFTILLDNTFCENIQQSVREILINLRKEDPAQRWEMIKMAIGENAIVRSSRLAKSRRNKIEVLERKMKLCQEQENNTVGLFTQDRVVHETASQAELDELLDFEVQGRILRSGARWIDLGEKPSEYFLNLEKHLITIEKRS